jgi:sugar phosphate isomerase/epimerase
MTSRRQFLTGAAAMLAAPSAFSPALAQRHIPLGLQLYTVRDDLAKDFDGTLKAVRAMGIRLVQSNLSMNGRDSKTLRKIYDDLGFTWDSIHAGGDALRVNPQATIDEAKSVGLKNVTCSFPLYPVDRAVIMRGPTLDDWKRDAETYNKVGELCRKAGLTFGYHNHNVEFKKVGDVLPYDLLLKETDPALVSMEMDIGWVVAGGADPVAYLTKYPTRYSSLHIKDLKSDGIPNTNLKMVSTVIGQGIVPWDKILPAAKKTKVRDAYLELEGPYVPSPTAMVKASYDWMKTRI